VTRRLTPEDRARSEEHRRELGLARDHRERQRRAETPRAHTLAANRCRKRDLVRLRLENDREEAEHPPPQRPRTRGECVHGIRPCPYVCPYSLLYEVTERGGLKVLHPDAHGDPDPDYDGPSCALDVADAGAHTLEEVAVALNISRERVRQLEDAGLANALSAAGRLLSGWESPC
jgi:hypothetical protein